MPHSIELPDAGGRDNLLSRSRSDKRLGFGLRFTACRATREPLAASPPGQQVVPATRVRAARLRLYHHYRRGTAPRFVNRRNPRHPGTWTRPPESRATRVAATVLPLMPVVSSAVLQVTVDAGGRGCEQPRPPARPLVRLGIRYRIHMR